MVGALANRSLIVDWSQRNPDVGTERIDAPLVVIGMFRAGTTFLSYLLEQDRRNRALLRWEAGDSVPPPTPSDYRSGPRVEAARAGNDMLEQINPRIRAIHHEEPGGPTECITLMSQDYKSLSWEAISNVPAYGRWLLEVDQVRRAAGALAPRSRRALRVGVQLDSSSRERSAMQIIGRTSPTTGSRCSRNPSAASTGSARPRPEHPIIDIRYDDLLQNPVAAVESIYAASDDSGGGGLDAEAHAALTEYVAAHPKDSLGVHGYDLAEFGLDPAQLRERFSGYVNRYDVPEERRGS